MEKTRIDSLKVLHRHLSNILERLYASPTLAVAAADNPVQAIEGLGYLFSPKLRTHIQERILSQPEVATRLSALKEHLAELGGGLPLPPEEAHLKLCEVLKVTFEQSPLPAARSRKKRSKGETSASVEKLGDSQASQAPLQEVYCLDTSSPQLADLELYRQLRNGNLPVTSRGRTSTTPPTDDKAA